MKLNTIQYLIRIVFFFVIVTSCATKSDGVWVKTLSSNYKIWIDNIDDSLLTYKWEGGVFDSVAHGNGILTILKEDSIINKLKIKAVYGTVNKSNIVSVNVDEQYVGSIENNVFEGYGIYIKKKEIYVGNFHKGLPHGRLTFYRNKKVYYSGEWEAGLFHGKGTLYKEDGTIKSGKWENGKLIQTIVDSELSQGHYKGYVKKTYPDGFGIMKYKNGNKYQGSWKEGHYHGLGLLCQDRDSILGYWEKGKLIGNTLYKTDDFIYDGGVIDNVPTGIGKLVSSDGSSYSGTWVDGKRNGIGDMLFTNGDTYFGEWENNEFHGSGKYIYNLHNSSYEGGWKNGLQDGKGYYRSPSFAYKGEWEKGWMNGEGILVFKNGDRYEGTIHENKIDGIGVYEYSNGDRYEGEFVSGTFSGNGLFQFKDGNRFEGEFYNGKIYGDGTLFLKTKGGIITITGFWPLEGGLPKEVSMLFENGDLYEGPFINGHPSSNGMWVSGKDRLKNNREDGKFIIHKANEFYKKHKETIDRYLLGASAVVTAIEISSASTGIGIPIAVVAHGVNIGINIVDASASIVSAGIDVYEAHAKGEDTSGAYKKLLTDIAINASFIIIPKVIPKKVKSLTNNTIKGVFRSSSALLAKTGKNVKKSALNFSKGKLLNKVTKVSIAVKQGTRTVEKHLIQSKRTQKLMIATGRLFTRLKDQAIFYGAYLDKLKKDPELLKKIDLTKNGSSKILEKNMRLCGVSKWINKNERIKRYLKLTRQVEAHHIIPSNPTTESSRKAKEIWVKYFGSVDHPCNGIWLGKSNKNGYKFLANGSNHGPNTIKYEEQVGELISITYNKYKKQYAKDPKMMQKILAESVDELKKRLYKGNLAIGGSSHQVHTTLSIFKESSSVMTESAFKLVNSVQIAIRQ